MRNIYIATLVYCLLGLFTARAAHGAGFEISEDGRLIAGDVAYQWTFVEVDQGAKVLFARVLVVLPEGGTVERVEGENISFDPKLSRPNGRFLLGVGAMETEATVFLKEGGEKKIRLKLDLPQTIIREDGCKEAGLRLAANGRPISPVFIGLRCEKRGDKVQISVSAPREVLWEASSLFEIAGKDQRWRVYEIPPRSPGSRDESAAAQFTFRNGAEQIGFTLNPIGKVANQAETAQYLESAFKARVGLGVAQIATDGASGSGSSIGPITYGDISSREIWWNIRTRALLEYLVPVGKASFYNFMIGAGPAFNFGPAKDGFQLTTFLDFVVMGHEQDVAEKSVTFRHNQVGATVSGRFTLLQDNIVSVSGSYNGVGGDSIGYGALVRLERPWDKEHNWGLGLHYLGESAKAVTGASVTFSQILLIGTYSL